MKLTELTALSPIDGRYRHHLQDLYPYFSEYGLMKYRVWIEVEYFLFLADKKFFKLPAGLRKKLQSAAAHFSVTDAVAIKKIESNEEISKKKKKENREATGAASAGQYSGPLFGEPTSKEIINPNGGKVPEVREDNGFNPPKLTMFSDEAKQYKLKNEEVMKDKSEKEIEEKWSQKYKDSINCSNPKGFSQRAHCQGKKKKAETKEATGAGSSGSYSQPAIWAKSTNKKDWAAARKTQIPGGQFVTIKKKCQTFPYCNQGDINALKLSENKLVQDSIKNVAEKYGINENIIKAILVHEMKESKPKTKK